MEHAPEAERSSKRKKGVRLAAALFFAGMLVLTFFSNTYQGLALPKVQVDKPSLGTLSYTIEGSGTLSAHHEVSLYDRSGWTVDRVLAEEGDRVKKGQVLAELDTQSAERDLMDEKDRYHKLELQLEQLQDRLKMNAINQDASELADAKRSIESLQDDMDIQRRKVEELEQDLKDEAAVKAPIDGIVSEWNAVEGLPDSQGQPVAIISDLSQGFDLTATVSAEQAEHIKLGRTVNLSLQGEQTRILKGTVSKLEDATAAGGQSGNAGNGEKQMTITVKDASLKGGEQVYYQWVETGTDRTVLVPTDAIHQDDQGEYVYVLKETKKPLGNEFHVEAAHVTIGDSDDEDTAILNGLRPDEQIVTDSSDPLSDGDRVRMN